MIRFKITVCTALLLAVFMPVCSSGSNNSNGNDTTNTGGNNNGNGNDATNTGGNGIDMDGGDSCHPPNLSEPINQKDAQGRRQGLWYACHADGTIRNIRNFLNDELHGESIFYATDGILIRRKAHYKNGEPHGKTESYYQGFQSGDELRLNNKADEVINYQDGVRHGAYEKWGLVGNDYFMVAMGMYTNGVKTGRWIDRDGPKVLTYITAYDCRGNYDENGNKIGIWRFDAVDGVNPNTLHTDRNCEYNTGRYQCTAMEGCVLCPTPDDMCE